jgi:hypothetical protein
MAVRLTANESIDFGALKLSPGASYTASTLEALYKLLGELTHNVKQLGHAIKALQTALETLVSAGAIAATSYTFEPDFEQKTLWVVVDCTTLDKVYLPNVEDLATYSDRIVKLTSEDGSHSFCGLVTQNQSYDTVDERRYIVAQQFESCHECLNA